MYGDVLLPTDGTEAMTPVVARAAEIAGAGGATVDLLYVVDDRAFLTLDDADAAAAELRAEGETALARTAATLGADGIEARQSVRGGDPAEEIGAHAGAVGADVIVMGAHTDYEENMLGSVSRGVVARAPVPVLTVPLAGTGTAGGSGPAPADD
jgi:nucleotide-binding universal stress UspA family protein